jgi:hypothetical protein
MKPTKKDSPAIHHGANRNNLPAVDYAVPHTMSNKPVSNEVPEETGAECMNKMNVSIASISKGNYAPTKTSGIEMRGAGAAIKGRMSRGPMA